MWYLLVQHISWFTDWVPKWALRQRGDGPLVPGESGIPLVFDTIVEAVDYVKRHDDRAFIEYWGRI